MKKKVIKIAIIHPKLKAGGGSEAVALWAIEALKNRYSITLITTEEPDFEILNECYGTELKSDHIALKIVPAPFIIKKRFNAIRNFQLVRYCQDNSSDYDVLISSYNVMDFKKKAIQIIGDFSFDDRLRRELDYAPSGLRSLVYKKSLLRGAYLKLSEILSRSSKIGWTNNFTIANSDWSRKILKMHFGINAITIFPPVIGQFRKISWEDRENGFVCLGRITPEKGIDHIISLISKVRNLGWNLHLHILGAVDDTQYGNRIIKLVGKNRDWIYMNGPVYGNDKLKILTSHKYGISGRKNEPFGIAVAEMVKAGNIVWVPNGGGQVEIVNHQLLTYANAAEAVMKISGVIQDPDLQEQIKNHLEKQSKLFSIEKYQSDIRRVVCQALAKQALLS